MIAVEDYPTITFQNSNFPTTVFQKLFEQKKASKFCDITLFVNNRIIKAHRNVLACSSPYFDSILKNHKVQREKLEISCTDTTIFNAVLNFMYTGEISINHSIIEELLRLADHFILTTIVEYCIDFLGSKLNVNNCLFTFFLSKQYKLKHLNDVIESWIAKNIDDICKGEEILRLDKKQLHDFFTNKNFVLTTTTALNLLSLWVQKDLEKREKHFDQLIKCFPTNDLEPIEVFKHLETNNLYNKSEFCLYIILDYLIVNNWMLSNFKTRYDVLHVKYGQISQDKVMDIDIKQKKIMVSEKLETPIKNSLLVKAKLRNRKQNILKKLMLFGLQPSVRMAALKMLICKKKPLLLDDEEKEEYEVSTDTDEKVVIKCPICFTTINDSLLLEQHLALSHAKNVTYKCGLCSFVCQYHGDYLNHMKTHFSGPPFKCDFCNFSVEQISKLITHRAHHLDESIYQCTFCTFKCRLKQNYISHMKMHTPDMFKCDHCSKTFRFSQNLEAHLLTHSADKNLSCDLCGFHTKFISHMIAHKRIHAADIYRCSYPHCKYTTSKKTQLASHAKSHNGVRPHVCGVCGRSFMEKSHLVRHERIHLEEKPFKCSHCDYASSRRDKLKEHYTRHHGENASAKVPYKARPLRNNGGTSKPKPQSTPDLPTTTTNTNVNFTQTNSSTVAPSTLGSEIQELIMHHQNHTTPSATNLTVLNSTYHHFGANESSDFHHAHAVHTHNIHNQILGTTTGGSHNQRSTSSNTQHSNNNLVNHHMLSAAAAVRSNPTTATSTAAAVAAAMMLDPRFHHNSAVPYPPNTPVSMAMAVAQSTQPNQSSNQQTTDYPPTLQNCMPLF
ncbi:zinc finger protein 879-like [Diorhabda carinulata]|uniref:zinc finger protein 879-like n=1 Tax=Diorhabda carinulata TaxID=1163345 RepID=UPI0025A0206A|nr:zinc finger protein 879-like [Diorhabda carinulata]